MSAIDFTDKPVKLIMENNIVSDIVYEGDLVKNNLKIILDKLDSTRKDPRDFFIVILERNTNKLKGIISADELIKMTRAYEKNNTIKFDPFCVKPLTVLYSESIENMVKLFESKKTIDIILVINEEGQYMGKIKRTSLNKKINELIAMFAS